MAGSRKNRRGIGPGRGRAGGRLVLTWGLVVAVWLGGGKRAGAQPLIRVGPDWRVSVGGRDYGLRHLRPLPGEFEWTEVWLGRYRFNIRGAMAEWAGVALVSPTQFLRRIDPRSFDRLDW